VDPASSRGEWVATVSYGKRALGWSQMRVPSYLVMC
jgi:hypothetical protein